MIKFTWDARKAERNERIHGVSFSLAQVAIESRLGVPIDEQYREDESRTLIVAPLRGSLLLQITLAFYSRSDDEDPSDEAYQEADQTWNGNEGIIRIISARKATTREQAFYFAARPQALG